MVLKLNAKQLRISAPSEKELEVVRRNRREIYSVLVDIYDTYNVGGIFRLAAAGTDRWVEWEYCESAITLIREIRIQNSEFRIIGIEQDERSVSIKEMSVELPLALVVGNETEGLSKEVLDLCDQVVELPMYGVNRSLNVIVAAAMLLGRV